MVHMHMVHGIDGVLPELPPQLMLGMHIRKAEERAMLISEDATSKWREENNAPDSDDLPILDDTTGGQGTSKRHRGLSTMEAGRNAKR